MSNLSEISKKLQDVLDMESSPLQSVLLKQYKAEWDQAIKDACPNCHKLTHEEMQDLLDTDYDVPYHCDHCGRSLVPIAPTKWICPRCKTEFLEL